MTRGVDDRSLDKISVNLPEVGRRPLFDLH